MNMTQKFAGSFVAVAAFSAIVFTSAIADSMKPAQSAAATASAPQTSLIIPLNSPETSQAQLNDLQFN